MTTTSTSTQTIDPSILSMQAAQKAADAAKTSGIDSLATNWAPSLIQFLVVAVFLVLALTLVMSAVLMWRNSSTTGQILRTFGVILIVGFATVLLVVGYSSEQLTPIIGLFGAIAGYLLGKDSSPSNSQTTNKD